MNVHGTQAPLGGADRVGADAKPSRINNDCQIQASEFAHMLTRLIDKPAEPSGEGAGTGDAGAPSPIKSER